MRRTPHTLEAILTGPMVALDSAPGWSARRPTRVTPNGLSPRRAPMAITLPRAGSTARAPNHGAPLPTTAGRAPPFACFRRVRCFPGQLTLSLDMDSTGTFESGRLRWLQLAELHRGQTLLQINYIGGNAAGDLWRLVDSTGSHSLGVQQPTRTAGCMRHITLTSAATYSANVVANDGSMTTVTGTLINPSGGQGSPPKSSCSINNVAGGEQWRQLDGLLEQFQRDQCDQHREGTASNQCPDSLLPCVPRPIGERHHRMNRMPGSGLSEETDENPPQRFTP